MAPTPRQEILVDTLNIVYAKKIDCEMAFEIAITGWSQTTKKYFGQMSESSINRLKAEVEQYLADGIILDYSDFEPGGRYA